LFGPFFEKVAELGAIKTFEPGTATPQTRGLGQCPGIGVFVALPDPQAFGHRSLPSEHTPGRRCSMNRGHAGRDRDATCDPTRVKGVLSRGATRPVPYPARA